MIEDRQKLSLDGVVNIALQINKSTKKMIGKAVVNTHGLVPNKEDKRFAHEIQNMIETFLLNAEEKQLSSTKAIQDELRSIIRKYIVRTKRRYPIITPTIFMA